MATSWSALRRRLAGVGGRPAAAVPPALARRADQAEYRPATLIEPPLRHHPLGGAVVWPEDVAFLDGTQHGELIGYIGTAPILGGTVRAAVRRRHDRRLRLACEDARRVIIGRREALAAFGAVPGHTLVPLDDEADAHPIRDLEFARHALDRERVGVEIAVARAFRAAAAHADCWLVADGTLSVSPDWASDPKMLGVVKSHAMLPFVGPELETYLTLPRGCRTSVFSPESRRVTPLYSWALRLHDFAGRDLFYGLLRVEAAAIPATLAEVDRVSRYLLAERAPLAADPRADRLLYGIHDVERFLHARGA